jgi:hypothetical protein
MSHEEIFEKAIENAKENGLTLYFRQRQLYKRILNKELSVWEGNAIIFSIPFANAFWGEKEGKKHLAKIIVAENPYEYLERFLKN